jgi:glycosyltransferase involved in cell wall biosynthesis
MNILHAECSLNWGGQEYRTLLEHLYLNTHGHHSWLMCHPQSKLYQKALEALAPNIVPINLTKVWRVDIAISIYRFCRRNAINVINTHGSRDSTLSIPSMLLGIPLIRNRQIINPVKKASSYQRLCTHVIASAEEIKRSMVAAGISSEKITVIGEGVDLEEFNPQVEFDYLRHEFNLNVQDRIILNIGMIRPDKGQQYYLEAANLLLKSHSELKFFLIGESGDDNQLEHQLRTKIKAYGMEDNVILTGYRQDIPAFMNLADLVVVSSLAEAQSRIVPQAFASGKTVVATHIGGLPELVQDGKNGLLVPVENPQAMADAILSIVYDDQLKRELEQNAYQFAQTHLSFKTMMDRILETYARFIKSD